MFLLGFIAILIIALQAVKLWILYVFIAKTEANFEILKSDQEQIKSRLALMNRPKKEEKWENMREAFASIPKAAEKNG